ncbi:MAG: DUF2993 domain-containing protein [Gordonia sp. (in: high G+C Gram-positive bacteria)]|uniref:LmeA family phospholipid-binding protein n=1 Tax=Gordonia sp. (in: high G+C Gram-positive bacteria) TaxID=84139 RepID=UPI0039E6CC03
MSDNTADRPDEGGHDESTDRIDPAEHPTAQVPADPTVEVPQFPGTPAAPAAQVTPPTRPHTREFTPDDRHAIENTGFGQIPPAAGPATGSVPPSTAAQPAVATVKKSKPAGSGHLGRTIALVSAAVLLLVLIGGVGTELYLRHRVTNCLQKSFGNLTGVSTDVSMPKRLMLQSWMSGDVPWVQVDTDDSGKSGEMRLHTRAEDVATDGKRVGHLSGNAFIPYDRVSTLADDAAAGADGDNGAPKIDKITGNAADGTLTIDSNYTVLIVDVPATVVVKPVAKDGKVTFQVQKASAVGIGLPNDFAQGVVDQVSQGFLGPLFEEIKVQNLKVTDTGVQLDFDGTDVNLQAASQVTGGVTACK